MGKQVVASVGELHPETAARFDLEAPVVLVVLDLAALGRSGQRRQRYSELSNQPRVRRDLAVLLDASVQAGDVVEAIRKAGGDALRSVEVFDRYEGRGVPDGKVSLAFRLDFQRADRALKDAEVTKATEKAVRILAERFGGELR